MLCYKLFTCKTNCSSHSFMAFPSSCCTVKKFSKSRSFMMDWAWSCSSKNPLLLGRGISNIFDQKQQYFVEMHNTFPLLQIFYQNFLPSIRLPRGISSCTCPKVVALFKMRRTWNLKLFTFYRGSKERVKIWIFLDNRLIENIQCLGCNSSWTGNLEFFQVYSLQKFNIFFKRMVPSTGYWKN